jgi:hypothetical protein
MSVLGGKADFPLARRDFRFLPIRTLASRLVIRRKFNAGLRGPALNERAAVLKRAQSLSSIETLFAEQQTR